MIRRRFLALALVAALTVPAAQAASATGHGPDRATVVRWVEEYLRAWRDKDDLAVGRIFTADAVYQEIPGDDAHTYVGRRSIQEYWRTITAGQTEVTTRYGEPLVQGDRAAVELWITLRANGNWLTFEETNVLYFARDGRVRRNVEYWIMRPGRFDPPARWGTRG
ncbi:nuclear transport factor 2 family protein [Actinocrispum wychmicini]|uniref:SnoaL-like protein n=1 Tax=Actinocrispum wychmicini TaxID=1213861 RepID=A0A4R2IZ01_9PSEU|nr:nuclear transport factor 2 family protein [Actinocrispum wychmicini]TCO50844.1 SnoaL-like protein [Actinocrispum wychmicini]